MTYQFPPDIAALIQQQLDLGRYDSPDQVLRVALEQLATQEEEVRAIQESIDQLDAGDGGVPLAEAFDRLRSKHDVPAEFFVSTTM